MSDKTKTMGGDLTVGPILPQLIRFAIPFVISNALQTVYAMVDMIVVGQFCNSAGVTAVSIGGQITWLLTALAVGFSSGAQVVIAQLMGIHDQQGMRRTIGTVFTSVTVLALLFTAVGIGFARPLIGIMNTPEEAVSDALSYLIICSAGMFFIYGYNVVSAILRGMGDSKRPLYFIAIASISNLALDLLFVAGFHWGTAGAAAATVIGQAISFIISLIYLYLFMILICHTGKSCHRFSLASGRNNRYFIGRIILHIVHGDQRIVRNRYIAQLLRGLDDINHGPPFQYHLTFVFACRIDDLLHPIHIGSKGRYNDPVLTVLGKQCLEGLADRFLGHGITGPQGIGGIAHDCQDPFLSQFRQTPQIDGVAVYRGIIHLKVPGIDQDSRRTADRKSCGIRDAVVRPYELDGKTPCTQLVAVMNDFGLNGIFHLMLCKLLPDQSDGKLGTVDRSIDIFQDIWDCSDMVFMTMGDIIGFHLVPVLLQVSDIRNDQINPQKRIICKCHAAVNDND